MTKELTKKVIEAGIVPAQAVKLMKMWKILDEDLPDGAKQEQTENELLEFVSQIGQLLEQTETLPEMKETMLGVTARTFDLKAESCTVILMNYTKAEGSVLVRLIEDSQGCYIFKQETREEIQATKMGNVVWHQGTAMLIIDVLPMYWGDTVQFMRCATRGLDPEMKEVLRAEMSRLREADEKSGPR